MGLVLKPYRIFGLTFAPFLGLLVYVGYFINKIDCETLFGFSLFKLTLLTLCYVVPTFFLFFSGWACRFGYRAIKQGCFPPLDAIVFKDTIVRRGHFQIFRAYVMMLFPLMALAVVFVGHRAYADTMLHWQAPQVNTTCSVVAK